MAKALVFSGATCPVCPTHGGSYGELALGEIGEHAMKSIQGAAIGAGAVIATDLIVPRILPTLSGTMRTVLQGGLVVLGSYMLKDKNPELATGIAIGGGAIIAYKLLAGILKLSPMSGLGTVMPEEVSGLGTVMPEEVSGLSAIEPEESYELSDIGDTEEILI